MLKKKQDCNKKVKETLRHHQADICVDDKEKLNRTLQTFKQNVDEDDLCQYRLCCSIWERSTDSSDSIGKESKISN